MFNLLTKVSLSSWDEAWYAVISRNILISGDLFNLKYNNLPFFDHPPFVFWLQSLFMKIFGVNDFSVRFPSFLTGIMTVILIYLLTKDIFKSKLAGLFAGLSIFSAPWFLTRSLSGNLDIPLTFLFVLSFYFAFKSRINISFLIPLSISLAFLFLTKSLVPLTIIPVLVFILYKKVSFKSLPFPILFFILLTIPWFIYTQLNHPEFIYKYFAIGYPGVSTKSNIWQNIMLTKTYLHNGIGVWFYPSVLSLLMGILISRKKFIAFFIFTATFLIPFMFSNKGHIWHLIPLYPFLLISFWGFMASMFKNKYLKLILFPTLLLFISFNQMKRNYYEIIAAPNYKSDIQILSEKTKEYPNYKLYLDDDAIPEAVWYSQKDRVYRVIQRGDIRKMFDIKNNQFLLITRDWRLNEEKIRSNEYTLIAKDRDKVLIFRK